MSDIYDLAILGGGPAGITAAIYASRARLNTIWIDKNFAPGGQITATYEVDNYPGMPGISGMDLGEAFGEHARKLGLEPQREKILSLENIVHRRDTLRADKALQEKVFACENIEMVWDSIPQEILGQEEVTGLKIRNVKTGEERELEADGVFIAVGIVPSTALVKDQLKLDENGYICAGEGVTSAPGVFAAGDIRTKALRQVVTAVSDGANAVASAQKYLWRTDNGNH